MNQITLEKHEHGKYCGSVSQPARRQQGQLIWKGASFSGKYKKKIRLILWAGPSPNSSGTGPARLEKRQLTCKIVKEKINLKSRQATNFIITTRDYCGSAPRPARLQKGQLIWRGTNQSEKN